VKNLRFSTVILSLVLAVLTVVSVILIKVVYSGAEKAIQHDIQLTYERDQRTLNSLMAAQFNNIRQISQELSKSEGVYLGLMANDSSYYGHIIDGLLADISGQYIDAIVVEEKGGSSSVFSNVSLLGIQLPLEQIIQHHSPLATWTSIMTEVEGKRYSLLHLSLPVIAEQFGEVIGKLHTFVLLNDNYWISNQLQEIFGAQAISLSVGNTILDGLESQPGQLQILRRAASNTDKSIISNENSTVRTHNLRIGNSDNYMVRSLLSNRSQQLLQGAYTTNLYYATILVIVLGAVVMLVIRYLIISALQQLTLYAEQVPPNGSPRPFQGGRFHEFIRVGRAVEKMLLRIRERDKHLSSIIDNSPDLIFIRDLQHNYQLFNQRFADVLNIKQEQLMSKQAQGVLAGDLIVQLGEADQQVLHSYRPIQYKMEIETNDGFSTFLMSKFPIMDDQGKLCSIGGIATDITEIKQAEEQLKLAQQVFSETSEAIIVLDNERNVLSSNRAFLEMSGFDKRDITTAIRSFLSTHPDILQHLQDAPRWQGEGSLLCFDGSNLPVLVSITHLSSESGGKRYVILFSDITKLKIAEQKIEKERLMLRATADILSDLIFFKDLQGHFIGCNKQFEKFVGCSQKEIIGKRDDQLFEFAQALMCQEKDREVMLSKQVCLTEEYLTDNNGQRRFIEMKKVPIQDENGQVQGLIGVGREITAHHQLQKRLKIADTALNNAKECILVSDGEGNIISANKSLCRASGYSESELVNANVTIFASSQHENIEAALQKKKAWQGELSYFNKNGEIHFAWLEVYIVEHAEEGIFNRIYTFIDLNQSRSVEEKIQFLSKHDPLTGLFNRIAFYARLEDAIKRAEHKESGLAILLVNINGFKEINDHYGHNIGDAVLTMVAQRLRSCVYEKDTVARFGNHEFNIIADELANEQEAAIVARKIIEKFNDKFLIQDLEISLSVAVGIAVSPDDGFDVDSLVESADEAMQRGKFEQESSYHFYTNELTHHSKQQFELEKELKQAIQQEQLELYYQPQYDLNKRRVVAVEALLYWNHPQEGVLHPNSFLTLAENSGLAVPIFMKMLRIAAGQAVNWEKSGVNFGRISLSLSFKQLEYVHFIAELQTILLETQCAKQWLEFEVDEKIFSTFSPTVHENLMNISKMGIALTVGNFGDNRAFLRLFEHLKLEKIKFSKQYSQGDYASLFGSRLFESMLAMANALGLDAVDDSYGDVNQKPVVACKVSEPEGRWLERKAMKASETTFYLRCNKRK
jgi:diguanylate cyclase (GGDEF)-like protein/PAS domain S-box-containing protein